MGKIYKVSIRTIRDDRMEVFIESDSIESLAKELSANQFTFIPKKHADFHSFSIFSHHIAKIDYAVVNPTPFEQVVTHDLLAFP